MGVFFQVDRQVEAFMVFLSKNFAEPVRIVCVSLKK